MITDESRKLRARIADALDHTTWEARIDAIETLIEERVAVAEHIAYGQGRAFGEQNDRDALDRANALIRRLSREALAAELAVERVREFVDGFAKRGDGLVNTTDELWIMAIRRELDGEKQ